MGIAKYVYTGVHRRAIAIKETVTAEAYACANYTVVYTFFSCFCYLT